ncbi:hypothetical protein [Bartonella sp. TS25HLJMH]|uniref:hypothetical protein n=2 Tax=unclassified Bartonella TaxID=2645622 RepID=UPI0035CEC9CE
MLFFIQADETLNLMVDQLTNKATVGFLSTYFLENVRFDQHHRILEADPKNRKGLVINKGACFRFYHGGENGGRYLFYRVPGRGRMSFDEDLEAGKDYYIHISS